MAKYGRTFEEPEKEILQKSPLIEKYGQKITKDNDFGKEKEMGRGFGLEM